VVYIGKQDDELAWVDILVPDEGIEDWKGQLEIPEEMRGIIDGNKERGNFFVTAWEGTQEEFNCLFKALKSHERHTGTFKIKLR